MNSPLWHLHYQNGNISSQDLCMQEWEDPVEFYGCGKFTSDSWRIFCRGVKASKGVEDATLLRYLRWLNTGSLKDPKPARPRMPKGALLLYVHIQLTSISYLECCITHSLCSLKRLVHEIPNLGGSGYIEISWQLAHTIHWKRTST